jgi:hypothetical protein
VSRAYRARQAGYALFLAAAGAVVGIRLLLRAWDEAFSDLWEVTP